MLTLVPIVPGMDDDDCFSAMQQQVYPSWVKKAPRHKDSILKTFHGTQRRDFDSVELQMMFHDIHNMIHDDKSSKYDTHARLERKVKPECD